MVDPTEPVDTSVTTDATLGDALITYERVTDRVDETASLLQHLREEQHSAEGSVFDITAAHAAQEVEPGDSMLWDGQFQHISSQVDARWQYLYRAIAYDEPRDGWLIDVPNGRVSWENAPAYFRETIPVESSTLVWAAKNVQPTHNDGSPGITVPLGGDDTMWIETEDDLTSQWGDQGTVRLKTTDSGFQVILSQGAVREQIPLSSVDAETDEEAVSIELAAQATEETQPAAVYNCIVESITNGVLEQADQIRLINYLTGQEDAVLLSYEGTTALLLSHIAEALDAHLTHIPQVGHVVLSREEKDGFESYAESFPTKQHLTIDDWKALCSWVGYPSTVTTAVLDDRASTKRGLETIARLYDTGDLDDIDVLWLQFAGYPPIGDEDAIIQAVERGIDRGKAIQQFDTQYGTEFAPHIREMQENNPVAEWTPLY